MSAEPSLPAAESILPEVIRERCASYAIGSRGLSPSERAALVELFDRPKSRGAVALGGRGNVVHAEVPGLGRVVVKRYMRGGLLRHLVRSKYLRWGESRGEVEFNLLCRVRSLGVNAPEPVAFATRGSLFYDAWLVTREVEGRQSLAQLSVESPGELSRWIEEMVRQLGVMITNRIFHVDLHPGNVLVGSDGKVYFIDFDKAVVFKGDKNELRDRYLVRWRRAVIKHHLPESLSELLCPGLRRNFDDSSRRV